MLYTYKAKDRNGEVYTGQHKAESRIELYNKVRSEGGAVLSVKEIKNQELLKFFRQIFEGISIHDKITFAKNLSAMLAAGLSMTRALDVMEKQARKDSIKRLIQSLSKGVSKGKTLSESLNEQGDVFPSIFISMVKAGEESGNLSESLGVIALQMDKSYTLSKRIRGAMIYPAVIFSLMIVIGILLLIYMVPTLTATFKGLGVELPLSTRVIIGMSDFMIQNTLTAVGALLMFAASIFAFIKSGFGRRLLDAVLIKVPVIGLITQEINSARTARTLSSLLSAGVPIVGALEVTSEVVPNHLYRQALEEAKNGIQKGETVSSVFGRYDKIYPAFITEMTAVGEETGKIAEMLMNVALYYEEDVEEKTKDLSTIIEPLLMIVIGAGVGVFALSMLAPTYSLVENI